jgi:hypothetical protein
MHTVVNNGCDVLKEQETAKTTHELLISIGESLSEETINNVLADDRWTLGEKLISIYDAPYVGLPEIRSRAARACAKLASCDGRVLEAVIKNADLYAMTQHSPDAYPYSPNSFEVLADIVPIYARVTSFLRDVVQKDWGVARACAAQALQSIEDSLGRSPRQSRETRCADRE